MNTTVLERANEIQDELLYLRNYLMPIEKALEPDSKFVPDLVIRLPNRIREGYSSFYDKDYAESWNYLESQNYTDKEFAEMAKKDVYRLLGKLKININKKIKKLEQEFNTIIPDAHDSRT